LYFDRRHLLFLSFTDCKFVFGGAQPTSLAATRNFLRVTSVGCVDRLRSGWQKDEGSIPGRGKTYFSPLRAYRLWGPTKPHIKWIPGIFSLGRGVVKPPGVKLMIICI
jgi:hypothetical protein